jgi:hypothetical protein
MPLEATASLGPGWAVRPTGHMAIEMSSGHSAPNMTMLLLGSPRALCTRSPQPRSCASPLPIHQFSVWGGTGRPRSPWQKTVRTESLPRLSCPEGHLAGPQQGPNDTLKVGDTQEGGMGIGNGEGRGEGGGGMEGWELGPSWPLSHLSHLSHSVCLAASCLWPRAGLGSC